MKTNLKDKNYSYIFKNLEIIQNKTEKIIYLEKILLELRIRKALLISFPIVLIKKIKKKIAKLYLIKNT
jgi:hypothetical protein